MIRNHLMAWRATLPASMDMTAYQNEVDKLSETDRNCAAALFACSRPETRTVIINAFHYLDIYLAAKK